MKRDDFLSKVFGLAGKVHNETSQFPNGTREQSLNKDVFHRVQLSLLFLTQETQKGTSWRVIADELCSLIAILAIARESKTAQGGDPEKRFLRHAYRKTQEDITNLLLDLIGKDCEK